MLFNRKPAPPQATSGHGLLDELEEHVASFHLGLGDIEDRMHDRHEAVQARMSDLEAEARSLQSGLVRVLNHRKAVQ